MPYSSVLQYLSAAFKDNKLPGATAHVRLSPAMRFPPNMPLPDSREARRSAVLLLLYPHQEHLTIALMQRSADGHVHSGQISFPGGGVELVDADLTHTALRETREEFGCDTDNFDLLGLLTPLHIPVSNSWVQPVVAFSAQRPHYEPDAKEVAAIIELRLADFLQTGALSEVQVKSGVGYTMKVPAFVIEGHVIWGATAMILNEFLEIYSQMG